MLSLIAVRTAVIAGAISLNGAEEKPGDAARNAALKYWAAWGIITQDAADKVNALEWKSFENETNANALPGEFHEAAKAVDPAIISALVAASTYRKCNFEIEYEQGCAAILPHLGKARLAARVLRLDARSKLAAGDAGTAAADVAAIYRMSAHLANDEVLISALVSIAIAKLADREVELLASSGALGAKDRDALLEAMATADAKDPFGVRRGIVGERRIGPDWIKQAFKGPDAGQQLVPYVAMGEANAEAVQQIAPMNGDQVAREADRYAAVFDEIAAAWDAPDAADRLGRIEQKLADGGYGPLGSALSPALSKARQADVQARAERTRITGLLKNAKPGGR